MNYAKQNTPALPCNQNCKIAKVMLQGTKTRGNILTNRTSKAPSEALLSASRKKGIFCHQVTERSENYLDWKMSRVETNPFSVQVPFWSFFVIRMKNLSISWKCWEGFRGFQKALSLKSCQKNWKLIRFNLNQQNKSTFIVKWKYFLLESLKLFGNISIHFLIAS